MASFADKVKVLIDVDSTGAVKGVADFKRAFGEAEGSADKLKVVGSAAFQQIKANATEFAAAAAVAIGKFALDATIDFQNLALEVGKFSDATGLSLDQASRILEVAGDLDIAATVVEKAILRMNLQAGAGEDKFSKFGIELQKHKDGTYDPTGTFLNVIDRLKEIRDPAEKARVGTELLGKGWKELTEIITLGGPGLARALSQVSDAKIVDQEDLEAARELRDALDTLKDRFSDVANNIGAFLLPKLAAVVESVDKIIGVLTGPLGTAFDVFSKGARIVADSLNPLDSVMSGIERVSDDSASAWERGYGALQTMGGVIPGVNTALDTLGGWLFGSDEKTSDLADSTDRLKSKFELSTIAANRMRYEGLKSLSDGTNILDDDLNGLIDSFDRLLGRLDQEETFQKLEENLEDYRQSVTDAFKKKTPEAIQAAEDKAADLIRMIAGVANEAKITSQEQIKIVALLEKGQFDEAVAAVRQAIDVIPKNIPITFTGTFQGIQIPSGGQTPSETIGGGFGPGFGGLPSVGGGNSTIRVPVPSAKARSESININVAGSVVTQSDLVESVRVGLLQAQKSGRPLVYNF
jgi:tetratricopeptide (TPR) repeat protein